MSLRIDPVKQSGVTINVIDDNVRIYGNIDDPQPGLFLEPFFYDLHDQIVNNDLKRVNVDVTELDFLNSSGIREFIDWLLKVEDLPGEKRYDINFLYSLAKPWQSMSFSSLELICPEFVKLVESDC